MKLLLRIIGAALFVIIFGLALHNMEEVSLHAFLGYQVKSPLVFFLFCFFVLGFIFGIIAMIPTVFQYRRDVSRLKKELAAIEAEVAQQKKNRIQPPQPDSVVTR